MKTFNKEQLIIFQNITLLIIVFGGSWIGTIFKLGYSGIYWQIGLFIPCALFVFYQLWKQKNYKEIKNRFIRTLFFIIVISFFVWNFKKFYIFPRIEEVKVKFSIK